MTITYNKQLILKRGNTSVSSTYTGAIGEITYDTDLKQIRVHDGVTAGGEPFLNETDLYSLTNIVWRDYRGSGHLEMNVNSAAIFGEDAIFIGKVGYEGGLVGYVNNVFSPFIDSGGCSFLTGDPSTLDNESAIIIPEISTLPFQENVSVVANPITDTWGNVYVKARDSVTGGAIYTFSNIGLFTPSNVIPTVSNVYSLGSATRQWKELWVSSNTVYIGGTPVSISGGTLLVNNSPVTGGVTGNIAVNSSAINFVSNSSGDGNGYSTIELRPDTTLSSDQYLIVDPTAPSHIHLRAGGIQDASNAELYLGGERNNVRVNDYSGVKLNNNILNSNTTRQFDITTDFTNATWSVIEPGVYFLRFSTSLGELQTVHDQFGSWPDNTIVVSDGTTTYTLTYNGYSDYLGNPNDRVIQVREAPPGGTTVNVQSMTFTIYTLQQNYISLEYGAFETYASDSGYIFANTTMSMVTGAGNFGITVDDNNSGRAWYFTTKGYLKFPQGVSPITSKGQLGDEVGSVVFDGSYIYYCTSDYTDGLADIWKRVAWSNDTW